MPSGEVGTVRNLERDSQACPVARAGDNVAVSLVGIDGSHVMAGGVLCHPDYPVSVAKHLELKVLVLDNATPILIGSQVSSYIPDISLPFLFRQSNLLNGICSWNFTYTMQKRLQEW